MRKKPIRHPFRDTFLTTHHLKPKIRLLPNTYSPQNKLKLWRDRHNLWHKWFKVLTLREIINQWDSFRMYYNTPECYKNGSPKLGELFLVFGTDSQDFHIYKVEAHGERGYTPHILRLNKVIHKEEPEIIYDCCCGICGVTFGKDSEGYTTYQTKGFDRRIIDLKSWNAWCQYHDDDYFL